MPANTGGKTAAEKMGTREKPPSSQKPSPPQASERITVALIPKAVVDLQSLQDRTGLSKTDLTNRAISLYEFIDKLIREGKEVLIRDPEEGETQRVHLL